VIQTGILVLFKNSGVKYTWQSLRQGWANYGPRAKYGLLRGSMRPAEGLENAKKNEASKNICANIIKPSKMKAE
jgi:hypothetical protein